MALMFNTWLLLKCGPCPGKYNSEHCKRVTDGERSSHPIWSSATQFHCYAVFVYMYVNRIH